MNKVFKKILGDPPAKTLRRMRRRTRDVNALEPKYKKMTDKQLKEQTATLKERLKKETLDKILPDAFAVVREAKSHQAVLVGQQDRLSASEQVPQVVVFPASQFRLRRRQRLPRGGEIASLPFPLRSAGNAAERQIQGVGNAYSLDDSRVDLACLDTG